MGTPSGSRAPEVADDGSAVEPRMADVDWAVKPGASDVRLVTVIVYREGAETSTVNVTVSAFDNETGAPASLLVRDVRVSVGPEPVVTDEPRRTPTETDCTRT